MPTYQYACTACGHAFEQIQSFSDDALTHCPECDGRPRKVFNAVGVVFKGSGFYRNDSRTPDSSSAPAPASDSAASDSKKADSTKSESKPATTSSDSSSSSSSSSSSGSSSSGSPSSD